ncbi:hypothetical protein BPORC_1862 [Bifidobacterium porcinum]|nr:hypothetical protein BPORC_1862 [Bifidobacterium porcinum]
MRVGDCSSVGGHSFCARPDHYHTGGRDIAGPRRNAPRGTGGGYLLGARRLGRTAGGIVPDWRDLPRYLRVVRPSHRTAGGIVADTTEPCHPSMAGF